MQLVTAWTLPKHFPCVAAICDLKLYESVHLQRSDGVLVIPTISPPFFPVPFHPLLCLVRINLVEFSTRTLHHEVAIFEFGQNRFGKVVHFSHVHWSPSTVVQVIVAHKERQHLSKSVKMQIPLAITLGTSESQQDENHSL